MKKKHNTFFRLVAKSLGEKSGKDDTEADKIAIIRILIFLSIFTTNGFIIFNTIRTHIIPRDYIQKVECINLK
jgi:hypothetical protein